MKIWLDDERPASDESWDRAKDHIAFDIILRRCSEPPAAISFDHDLGENSENGSWCAGRLINIGIQRDWDPTNIEITIHSSNPDGAKNIASKIESWRKFWRQENP